MCGGSKDVTESKTNQEQQYKPAGYGTFKDIVARGQAASQLPYTPVLQGVADLTPGQLQAIGSVSGSVNSPYMASAAAHFENAANPLTAANINQYFNPYADQVMANLQEVFGQQNVDEMGKLTKTAGGIGADRLAVARGELSRQQGLAAGQTLAQVYQNALQAAQNQQGIEQASGYGLGNLWGAQLQGNLAALQANMLPWQVEQMKNTAQYEESMRRAGFPYAQTQFYAGIGLPAAGAMGGTTIGSGTQTVNPPDPNPFSQIAGGALTGASIGGPWGALAGAGIGAIGAFAKHGGKIVRKAVGGPYSGPRNYIPELSMGQVAPSMPQMQPLGFLSPGQQQTGGVGGKGSNIAQSMASGNGIFDGFSVGSPEENMGWSTNVTPSGMSGWGNFLSNALPFGDGGRIEDSEPYKILSRIARGKGGEVKRDDGGEVEPKWKGHRESDNVLDLRNGYPAVSWDPGNAFRPEPSRPGLLERYGLQEPTEPDWSPFKGSVAKAAARPVPFSINFPWTGEEAHEQALYANTHGVDALGPYKTRPNPDRVRPWALKSGGNVKGYAFGGSPFFSPSLGGAPIYLDEEDPSKLSGRLLAPPKKSFFEQLKMDEAGNAVEGERHPIKGSPFEVFGGNETIVPKRQVTSSYAKSPSTVPVATDLPPGIADYPWEATVQPEAGGDNAVDYNIYDPDAGGYTKNGAAVLGTDGRPVNPLVANDVKPSPYLPTGGVSEAAGSPAIAGHEAVPQEVLGGDGDISAPGNRMTPEFMREYFGPGYQPITNPITGKPMSNTQLGLLAAGLGIWGGESPYFGVNVGQGASQGISTIKAFQEMDAQRQARAMQAYMESQRLSLGYDQLQQAERLRMFQLGASILDQGRNDDDQAAMELGKRIMQESGAASDTVIDSTVLKPKGYVPSSLMEIEPTYPEGVNRNVAVNPDAVPPGLEGFYERMKYGPRGKSAYKETGEIMEKAREASSGANDAIRSAMETNHYLNQVQNQNGFLTPGTFHAERTNILRAANTIARMFKKNFNEDYDLAQATKDIGNAEALGKLQTYSGFSLARTLGTREAMQVIQQALAAVAGGQMTPAGAKNIVYSVLAGQKYQKDKYRFLSNWQNQYGIVTGVDAYFDTKMGSQGKYVALINKLKEWDELRSMASPEDAKELFEAISKEYLIGPEFYGGQYDGE